MPGTVVERAAENLHRISVGSKLIALTATHFTVKGLLLFLGKEFALDSIPEVKAVMMQENLNGIAEVLRVSINSYPLTVGIAFIVYNWKGFTGSKLASSSAVLWVCLFIGSWLHFGIDYNVLYPGRDFSLGQWLARPGSNFYIQLLTYPLAVFFQVYGLSSFCISVLVGFFVANSFMKTEKQKAISTAARVQKKEV